MPAALLFSLIAPASASAHSDTFADQTLQFGCRDIVVIGRVQNGAFSPIEDDSDLLGHGRIAATVNVRKVVRGSKLPAQIPVSYVAHNYMRDDREFMLVLRRGRDGVFSIETGQLMSYRPHLASHCEERP